MAENKRVQGFPKSARLLKKRDFKFRPYRRFETESFNIIYCPRGQGRIGISISKKVLRLAAARNRVRRMIREVFRLNYGIFQRFDIHVMAAGPLKEHWMAMKRHDVETQLKKIL